MKIIRRPIRFFWRKITWFAIPQWILAILIYLGIWLVYFTSKRTVANAHLFDEYRGKPVVFVGWHGRSMMLAPVVWKNRMDAYVIASPKQDGRLMAKMLRLFGVRPIFGATNDRGVGVLRTGVEKLRQGNWLALSPDGPSGPNMKIHDGVLYFAVKTGAPIISVCFSCDDPWIQGRRWDKYMIALPFSRVHVELSKPIFVTSEKDREKVEKLMIEQQEKLDSWFGLKSRPF